MLSIILPSKIHQYTFEVPFEDMHDPLEDTHDPDQDTHTVTHKTVQMIGAPAIFRVYLRKYLR